VFCSVSLEVGLSSRRSKNVVGVKSRTVKQSHHAMDAQGGEEVLLLLIHDLDTRWG
jgi:hypothetical protein